MQKIYTFNLQYNNYSYQKTKKKTILNYQKSSNSSQNNSSRFRADCSEMTDSIKKSPDSSDNLGR